MTAAASPADAILAVDGLDKHFGGLRAVAGASFSVRRGSRTALIGPNGAGKTTLFDLVTGFSSPDRGTILFDGRAIGGMAPHRICMLGLARTFQLTRVFAALPVVYTMMLAARGQPGESLCHLLARARDSGRSEIVVRERALALLRH